MRMQIKTFLKSFLFFAFYVIASYAKEFMIGYDLLIEFFWLFVFHYVLEICHDFIALVDNCGKIAKSFELNLVGFRVFWTFISGFYKILGIQLIFILWVGILSGIGNLFYDCLDEFKTCMKQMSKHLPDLFY